MTPTYSIDQDRWAKLSIFEQMGNIYSEVGRSFKAKQSNDIKNKHAATNRAIDLFDATIKAQIAVNSPKSREILRSKEQFLDLINDDNASDNSIQSLDRYFMQFAIAARLNR